MTFKIKKVFQFGIAFYLIFTFLKGDIKAQEKAEWQSFHGPDRTNKSTETGLLTEWPVEGPELFWTISGLGKGYGAVSIADGYLFTSGIEKQQTYIFAYDLEGHLVWKKPNGQSWETEMPWARTYNGSRSTPTYSDGILYHLVDMAKEASF